MSGRLIIAFGTGLAAVAALPPLAGILEARLVTHLLVQYPLLVGGGALIGATLARSRPLAWSAAPALLAGVLTLAFWLIPRWIDASLVSPWTYAAKIAALSAMAGPALGWGWVQAGGVLRAFVVANAVSMLAVMGWLQLVVPARLCNAYLLDDQRQTGTGFIALAVAIVLSLVLAVLAAGPATARPSR